jgi:hypothetical protein
MLSLVLGDLILESLTPCVNAPLDMVCARSSGLVELRLRIWRLLFADNMEIASGIGKFSRDWLSGCNEV